MSYLQKYVRQVRPQNETYIPPVEKVQSFLTEAATTEATLMENVIVACWNNRKLKKGAFAKKIVNDTDVKKWHKISKLAAYNGIKLGTLPIADPQVVQALYEFSSLLVYNAPMSSGKAKPAGRSDPSTSAFWEKHTGKGSDTSKADIMIGDIGISVKGISAVLMSGVAAETKATALAAFARAPQKPLPALQQKIITAIDDMIGSSDRIDIEAPPEAEEKNTRSMGQLTTDDAIKYGLQKKDGGFKDDRWLTSGNIIIMQDPDRGEKVTDWTKVNYDVMPPVKVKDATGKSVELTDDTKKKAVIDRVNAAAGNAIATAKNAKTNLETDLLSAFNTTGVKEAFAWEAMSGWDKFNKGPTKEGNVPDPGTGGTGFAKQMLAFDWELGRIAWYEIKPTGPNVKKTATQMSTKFDLKSASYEASGAKAGYSFSQTLRFGIKYIKDKTDDASLTMEEKTHEAKQMLSEGLLNEWSFWEKLKNIWNSFISALKIYWKKFVDFLSKIKDKIVEVFDSGINSVLNYFELGVSVKVNTTVRLL